MRMKEMSDFNYNLICGLQDELEHQRKTCEESRFYDFMHMVTFLENAIQRAEKKAQEDTDQSEARKARRDMEFAKVGIESLRKDVTKIMCAVELAGKVDLDEVIKTLKETPRKG